MKVIQDLKEWRSIRQKLGKAVGFVPTMGALHLGHYSLIHRSLQDNPLTVASIFVNPTQFDEASDLESYPNTLEEDLTGLEEQGCDFVLIPSVQQMYPFGYRYKVHEQENSQILCGEHRPGHFDGMLTVVLKLLNLVRPERAYFGEKDFQQLQLVRDMAVDLFLEVEIIACPTLREEDGLALSSRNRKLCPESRQKAARFAYHMQQKHEPSVLQQLLEEEGMEVDYVQRWRDRQLAAVRLQTENDTVRLIDNVSLEG